MPFLTDASTGNDAVVRMLKKLMETKEVLWSTFEVSQTFTSVAPGYLSTKQSFSISSFHVTSNPC